MKCKMFPGGVEAWKAHVIMAVQDARWISAETHMEQIKAMILRSIAVDTSCWYHACWYQVCTKGMTTHSFNLPGCVQRPHGCITCILWFAEVIPQLYSYIICYDQKSWSLLIPKTSEDFKVKVAVLSHSIHIEETYFTTWYLSMV